MNWLGLIRLTITSLSNSTSIPYFARSISKSLNSVEAKKLCTFKGTQRRFLLDNGMGDNQVSTHTSGTGHREIFFLINKNEASGKFVNYEEASVFLGKKNNLQRL